MKECPARLYLLYHAVNDHISLFQTDSAHANHDSQMYSRGLPQETKDFVKEKFEEGVQKPNAILDLFRAKKLAEPPKSKLIAFLRRLREEEYGVPTISGTELQRWCQAHSSVPADEDQPFVVRYNIVCHSFDPNEQKLKIVISTRRLLNVVQNSEMLQADGTYKLVWQGYPVLIVGTSEKNNTFHPACLAICDSESADDYEFVFRALSHKFRMEAVSSPS